MRRPRDLITGIDQGTLVTITGTKGDDFLSSTAGADLMQGNDSVIGKRHSFDRYRRQCH
jgi:hypothetical protein